MLQEESAHFVYMWSVFNYANVKVEVPTNISMTDMMEPKTMA